MCLKLPPTVLPIGTVTLPPRMMADTRRRAHGGVVIHPPLEQLDQQRRALRVADDDHAPASVVMGQVVHPGRLNRRIDGSDVPTGDRSGDRSACASVNCGYTGAYTLQT